MRDFIEAVKKGDIEDVRHLVSLNPSLVNERDTDGATAVQVAVYNRQREVADYLVDAGAALDLPSAAVMGDTARVQALATPHTVDQLSDDGFLPLALAAAFGGPSPVLALINLGADVNARSVALGGVAPLHAAVFGNDEEVVRVLLESGADPDLKQELGFTPLMGAAQNGNPKIVGLLLSHGADRTATTSDGQDALDFAKASGNEDCVRLLSP